MTNLFDHLPKAKTKVRRIGRHMQRLGFILRDQKTGDILVQAERISKITRNRFPCDACGTRTVLAFLEPAGDKVICQGCLPSYDPTGAPTEPTEAVAGESGS